MGIDNTQKVKKWTSKFNKWQEIYYNIYISKYYSNKRIILFHSLDLNKLIADLKETYNI